MSATPLPIARARPAATAAPVDAARPAITGESIWRWALYDVAVWATVAMLFSLQALTRPSRQPINHILLSQLASFGICALFTPLVVWVTLRYRFGDGNRVRALVAHLACLLAFLTIGSMTMAAVEWSLPWVPAGDGVAAAMRASMIRYFSIDVLLYVLIVTAVLMIANGRESRERSLRAARLQTQLAEAQLHALGAQLHPHFLFNTLHVISALVRPDPKRAEQLIARLSELLREMLDRGDRAEIALADELGFLEKYVDIQEARFGPRLRVNFEVAPSAMDVQVPRLILQPLVENAIQHGIARRATPGTVEVSAACADDRLTLVVRDDGVGMPSGGQLRSGVGLTTTRARLAQLYGDAAAFTIEPGPAGGTVCTVRIPCIRSTVAGA